MHLRTLSDMVATSEIKLTLTNCILGFAVKIVTPHVRHATIFYTCMCVDPSVHDFLGTMPHIYHIVNRPASLDLASFGINQTYSKLIQAL